MEAGVRDARREGCHLYPGLKSGGHETDSLKTSPTRQLVVQNDTKIHDIVVLKEAYRLTLHAYTKIHMWRKSMFFFSIFLCVYYLKKMAIKLSKIKKKDHKKCFLFFYVYKLIQMYQHVKQYVSILL